MMLKIEKNKLKLFGIITYCLLLSISYAGLSFYSIPEKANAVTWFPEEKTIADISTMQEMTSAICNASAIGDNATLADTRDDSTYTVKKLSDGKCWMTQNLRIVNEAITSSDSNVTSNYTIPASALWSDTDNTVQKAYYNNNTAYGAYYSWCAATAGTCDSAISDNTDAPADICPKGWQLPKSGTGTANDFAKMGGVASSINANTNYWGSAVNPSLVSGILTVNDNTWPAAGFIRSGNLNGAGSNGHYWSRTAINSVSAYRLYFYNDNFDPANTNYRYDGYPVRCIAKDNYPAHTDSTSGSITVRVANIISIDAVSGMEEEVDSTSIANGTITATVATNASSHKVLLSAEKTSLTSSTSSTSTNQEEIPATSVTNPVQPGTNAWGIATNSPITTSTTYVPITNTEQEYYNTTTNSTNPLVPGIVHTFNIGISVSPSLPADTYSTDLTITAVAG